MHDARCHARSGVPRDRRDATSYHAFARDTEPRRLAQRKASHQGRVARTSARCYTRGRARTRYSKRALTRVTTSANRTKHTHHMEQRVLDRVQPRVVCPISCRCCAFGVVSTDRYFGVWMKGSDAPDACVLFCALNSNLKTKT